MFYEPFVGTGAVLATLQPDKAVASDTLEPLIDFWHQLQTSPDALIAHYEKNWEAYQKDRKRAYENAKARYNDAPNPFDLMFISRTCYGGVIRFTKEHKISTPIGPHNPIKPDSFAERVHDWRNRVQNCEFVHADYKDVIAKASKGDLIYCDPPYTDSQTILYGAQMFVFSELLEAIDLAKKRGAMIALSIDGDKKSGKKEIDLGIPDDLFEHEMFVDCGHSMLRRFQKGGETMEGEKVRDRLLLTW